MQCFALIVRDPGSIRVNLEHDLLNIGPDLGVRGDALAKCCLLISIH